LTNGLLAEKEIVMLEVQPLMQPPGAIVYGWDPQAEVSAQDRTEILRGLRLYQVLMFHKHAPPGDKDLTHFAASFGDLVKGRMVWRNRRLCRDISSA